MTRKAIFGGITGGLMLSFLILMIGGLSSLMTYATCTVLYLLIVMDANTRSVALQVQMLAPRPVQPRVEAAPAPTEFIPAESV